MAEQQQINRVTGDSTNATSVADIFRRAQAIKRERAQMSYKELTKIVASEFDGREFPPMYNLTIPEQDKRAPEEDWTAGLSIIARGIQMRSWAEVASGIMLCLEQTEGYESEHGNTGAQDEWHDRSTGIKESLTKGVNKWMPDELMKLAEDSAKGAEGRANASALHSLRRVKAGRG